MSANAERLNDATILTAASDAAPTDVNKAYLALAAWELVTMETSLDRQDAATQTYMSERRRLEERTLNLAPGAIVAAKSGAGVALTVEDLDDPTMGFLEWFKISSLPYPVAYRNGSNHFFSVNSMTLSGSMDGLVTDPFRNILPPSGDAYNLGIWADVDAAFVTRVANVVTPYHWKMYDKDGNLVGFITGADAKYNGGGIQVFGTDVVGAQGAAVADVAGGAVAQTASGATACLDAINLILARLRAHGLIAT